MVPSKTQSQESAKPSEENVSTSGWLGGRCAGKGGVGAGQRSRGPGAPREELKQGQGHRGAIKTGSRGTSCGFSSGDVQGMMWVRGSADANQDDEERKSVPSPPRPPITPT